MAIVLTDDQRQMIHKFMHRDTGRALAIVMGEGGQSLGDALLTEITNDERHRMARQALDLLYAVGLRNPDITLGQLVVAADWIVPGSEA